MRDPRARFSALCLSLPEARAEEQGRHASFAVRRKRFAWYLDDHHGDGRLSAHLRAAPGRNRQLAQAAPQSFFIPAYLGPRGWAGVHLDLEQADWNEIEGLVLEAYLLAAPKRLAERLLP